jgi:hypothetical protein
MVYSYLNSKKVKKDDKGALNEGEGGEELRTRKE